MTGYVLSALTPDERRRVARDPYVPLTWNELPDAIANDRHRVYGYLEGGAAPAEVVRLATLDDLERYRGRLAFAWIGGITVAQWIQGEWA